MKEQSLCHVVTIFSVLRILHTGFHSDYTSWHSPQNSVFSSLMCQPLSVGVEPWTRVLCKSSTDFFLTAKPFLQIFPNSWIMEKSPSQGWSQTHSVANDDTELLILLHLLLNTGIIDVFPAPLFSTGESNSRFCAYMIGKQSTNWATYSAFNLFSDKSHSILLG